MYMYVTEEGMRRLNRPSWARVIGIVFLVFGIPGLLTAPVFIAFDVGIGLLITIAPVMLTILGIVCLVQANQTAKIVNRYKRYIDLVANQGQYSIAAMARSLNIDYRTALTELEKMLELGYFPRAQIDYAHGLIVLPPIPSTLVGVDPAFSAQQGPAAWVVKCRSCGASTTLDANQQSKCPYCGSPL